MIDKTFGGRFVIGRESSVGATRGGGQRCTQALRYSLTPVKKYPAPKMSRFFYEAQFDQENCRFTGGRRDEGEYKGMFAGIGSCRMLPHGLEDPDRDL